MTASRYQFHVSNTEACECERTLLHDGRLRYAGSAANTLDETRNGIGLAKLQDQIEPLFAPMSGKKIHRESSGAHRSFRTWG